MRNTMFHRAINWSKENLFKDWANGLTTIICLVIIYKTLVPFVSWLFVDSIWTGTAETCRETNGACLAFLREKSKFIVFGLYPDSELWRPTLLMVLFVGLAFYSKEPKRWGKSLLLLWGLFSILVGVLLKGMPILGIPYVDSLKWGGLPLTLMLSSIGMIFSYPIGILLALGRRSKLPFIRTACICYIELIRGIPLISLLFMASVMFPLFLPKGIVINKLFRAQVAIIMFSSAYMAEVVRGGLQAIPKGQYEAAQSLGLNYYQTMRYIILPQALKLVIPPTINTFIGLFKDTSLVIIIALFDLLSTTKTSLTDSDWLGFSLEAYLFASAIYFVFCYSLSRFGTKMEKELGLGAQRH